MKCLLLLSFGLHALAATVSLNWDVGWVTADPDKSGHSRRVIGVNGKWPPPQIDVNVGDRLQVKINNKLGDWNTTIHWHGIRQRGTNNFDGPEYVTQCPISPGHSMTYDFPVTFQPLASIARSLKSGQINQAGTYWYHSHVAGQYPDGLRGPLVVHDSQAPFKYDEEIILTVSDWYYKEMRSLIPAFLNRGNPDGVEPFPDTILIDNTKEPKLSVQPNKTYLIRVINMGAFLTYALSFEGHDYEIVEVDGIYTNQAKANQILVAPAQRYSILLKTKTSATQNYPFVAYFNPVSALVRRTNCNCTLTSPSQAGGFTNIPPGFNGNATGWLVYNDYATLPKPQGQPLAPFDDTKLVPVDGKPIFTNPDRSITLNVSFQNKADGINYAFFNDISYQAPQVPTLFTALNANSAAVVEPLTYGRNVNPFVIKKGQVIQLIINNFDGGPHPFHLHGHDFQVLYRSPNEGQFHGGLQYPPVPMRRDTVIISPMGFLVLRFTADNPGIWLFHCHIEWHILQGLTSTFIEAPEQLKGLINIPQDQHDICTATGIDVSPDLAVIAATNHTVNNFAAPDTPPSIRRRDRGRLQE